jgi:glutaminyl-tRNA synthetase
VRWLGYTPDKITFASDYFEQLQYFAHRLIQQGNAYVCDSSQEEIEVERKNKQPNPYRQRSIE